MKRFAAILVVALTSALTLHPAVGAEKSSIQLSRYSTYSTAASLGFNFTGSADQVRITVDPNVVTTRSALAEKSSVSGVDYTFNITTPDSVELTLITPALKVQGAHRAKAELISGTKGVASTTFFLSQLGGKGVRRTPVVWLWPITERPHRGLDNTFLDDQLATDVAPNGRLTRLVKAGAANNVVWALDPELLAAVEQMSLGYQVRRGDQFVDGTGVDDAKVWLEALRAATAGREVITLPYADPDLSSIAATDVESLRSYGVATVSRVLNRNDLISDVAWPADGKLGAAAKELRASIVRMPNTSLNATPSAVGPLVSTTRTLIADQTLTNALGRQDVVGANRAIAEIATITAERPADSRIQLLLPPRLWNPNSDAVLSLLGATRNDLRSWSYLMSRPAGEGIAPSTGASLPRAYRDTLRSMIKKVEQTQGILGVGYEPSLDRFNRAFTAVNSNFRTQKSTLIDALDKSATSFVNTLRILPGRYVLTGKDQTIPITIVNGFDKPVRLSVDIEPHAPRVIVDNAAAIDVPANGRTQLQVPVTSVAAGRIAADAFIISSDGERYGDGVVLNLDIRNIGPIGNWILYGSVALLALAVLLRLTRSIRRRGRS